VRERKQQGINFIFHLITLLSTCNSLSCYDADILA